MLVLAVSFFFGKSVTIDSTRKFLEHASEEYEKHGARLTDADAVVNDEEALKKLTRRLGNHVKKQKKVSVRTH